MAFWIWLLAGLALIFGELIIPGLVAVFFGAGALLMAGVEYFGLIDSVPLMLGLWFAVSLGFLGVFRGMLQKWIPAEATTESTDGELAAYGSVVDVIEDCDDSGRRGRIRFQGTTWPAFCIEGRISAGQKARLLYRDDDGIGWIVERLDELPSVGEKEV